MTATLIDRDQDGWQNAVETVVQAAERLLEKRTGAGVTLADAVDLGGSGDSIVVRVRVAENPFSLPRTLVLKQIREDSGAGLEGFRREAVSYKFANSLIGSNRPGPELIASDIDERLLVLADLGDAPAMGDLLTRRDEAEVTRSLVALTQALGRMHANTFGREEDYIALLKRNKGEVAVDPLLGQVTEAADQVPALLAAELGVTVTDEVIAAAKAGAQMFGPGGLRAFSTADLCPDNILVNESGVKFLDYEWGGFRDAVLDISYVLASFPACLCTLRVDKDQARAMIDAWRAEVTGVFPQLRDDQVLFGRLIDAMLIWTWLSTYLYLVPDADRVRAAGTHELAVSPAEALANRWRILVDFAEGLDAPEIAAHAREVVSALAS